MQEFSNKKFVSNLEIEMKKAASELDFERAMELSYAMFELSTSD